MNIESLLSPNLVDAVKLVIWDLDNTFWQGTFTEGGITYLEFNHQIVITLSERGIINSICSINKPEEIKSYLIKQSIWDYFVFSSVSLDSKGPRVQNIIENMLLRPENVLFIDDENKNLEEARYFCPGLQISTPNILPKLLLLDPLKGNPDPQLSRLKKYKLLEQKHIDKNRLQLSNREFLTQSNIKVAIKKDCENKIDRIMELIKRTNQLNFTKKRIDIYELKKMLSDNQVNCAYIEVSDKYGDYGVVGFYALTDKTLLHFLFSCRVLNMGIEQWVYQLLEKPQVDIIGDVSSNLYLLENIDWINQSIGENSLLHKKTNVDKTLFNKNKDRGRILMKGGCDLEQVVNYSSHRQQIDTEFNYVNRSGIFIHNEHTEILRQCHYPNKELLSVIHKLPFLDETVFSSKAILQEYDILIYSVLMDYTQGIYKYRDTSIKIPYLDFNINITEAKNWEYVQKKHNCSENFLQWFRDNFTYLGPLSPDDFAANIFWMCEKLTNIKYFIFINGAEFPIENNQEVNRHIHHATMNASLLRTVERLDNIRVCDIRQYLKTKEDFTDNIRHYQRQGYSLISAALDKIIESINVIDNQNH